MLINELQALAAVLAHLVKMASAEFGVPYIRDVVVSTPAIFHDSQRQAVRCACKLAGICLSFAPLEIMFLSLSVNVLSIRSRCQTIGGRTFFCSHCSHLPL